MQQSPFEEASTLLAQLEQCHKSVYADFMALCTKVSSRPESVLGTCVKWLRQTVKQLSCLFTLDEAIALLHERAFAWYEYKIIFGGVTGCLTTPNEGLLFFYPLCDGWAMPDYYKGLLTGWASRGEVERQIPLRPLVEHAHDTNPYARRFTIAVRLDLIRHGLATPRAALDHAVPLQHDEVYYVQMAIAWLLAEVTLTGEPSLTEVIRVEITDATVLRMYQQKFRDSLRSNA